MKLKGVGRGSGIKKEDGGERMKWVYNRTMTRKEG